VQFAEFGAACEFAIYVQFAEFCSFLYNHYLSNLQALIHHASKIYRTRSPAAKIYSLIFILFFWFVKNMYLNFFLQICHPAACSSGGRELPPDELAVSELAHGPFKIPQDHTAVRPSAGWTGGRCYHRATAGYSRAVAATLGVAVWTGDRQLHTS